MLKKKRIRIFDGLKDKDLSNSFSTSVYKATVPTILAKHGISISRGSILEIKPNSQFQYELEALKGKWLLEYDEDFLQEDSCSCGPLACMKAAELLSDGKLILQEPIRKSVLELYNEMLHGDHRNILYVDKMNMVDIDWESQPCDDYYDMSMTVGGAQNPLDLTSSPPRADRGTALKAHQKQGTRVLQNDRLESIRSTKSTRAQMEGFARKRQKIQAERVIQQFEGSVKVEKGDVVVVVPDVRERCTGNSLNIVGIVIDVGKGAGVKVVTQSGILSHGTGKRPLYVPHDRWYKTDSPIHLKLREYQASILGDTFNEKGIPRVTMASAHKQQTKQPTVGVPKCQCGKKGKCGNRCSCCRNNLPCSSGCKCGGTCPYMREFNFKPSDFCK